MPIKIPDGLPAGDLLAQENIFVMPQHRAATQDIRPLRIAIMNLMPTKQATETQLLRMLANSPLQVEVTLLHTGTYQSQNTSQDYLDSFYRTFDEVKHERFDGLVITGAPVENLDFTDVHYWDELVRLMDWADSNVFSTLYICWAAQAGCIIFTGWRSTRWARRCSVYSRMSYWTARISSCAGSMSSLWRRTRGTRRSMCPTRQRFAIWIFWLPRRRRGCTSRRRTTGGACSSPGTASTTQRRWSWSTGAIRRRASRFRFRRTIIQTTTTPSSR